MRAITFVVILDIGLVALLLVAQVVRVFRDRRRNAARAEVRQKLAALAQQPHRLNASDLAWWLAHADALADEVTPALASNPSLRTALEALSSAAAPMVVDALEASRVRRMPGWLGGGRSLRRAARLVALAPTRSARRALLALEASGDEWLAAQASAAIVRHPAPFADVSPSLAYLLARNATGAAALGTRAALARIVSADGERAAVHLGDSTPAVRGVALAGLDATWLSSGQLDRETTLSQALAATKDADHRVRAAAFDALPRITGAPADAEIERGLRDPVSRVRAAAARAIAHAAGDTLALLRTIDRKDAGLGRLARLDLRARGSSDAPGAPGAHAPAAQRVAYFQRLALAPSPLAEPAAADALGDPEPTVRREAALALAALARTRSAPRLGDTAIETLLARLPTEGSSAVVRAFVEALEVSGDRRAAEQLADHAVRARPGWRMRLTEAAALARAVDAVERSRDAAPRTPDSRRRR